MQKSCKKCKSEFQIHDRDLGFYDKISPIFNKKKYQIPTPTLCPNCRMQRRLAWRTREYFLRKCDLTGKQCLSIYPPTTDLVTYSGEAFFGDQWDGTSLGRDFDFNKTFFEQFNELYKKAPKNTANVAMNENCEYIINAHENKNCYLGDEMDYSKDCIYGYNIQKCIDVLNGFYIRDSQLCYETQQAENCYEVFFSHNVFNCNHSAFLKNCRNVKNSLFCANLQQAEYCIFNKQVTKEEFEIAWKALFDGSFKTLTSAKERFSEFIKMQKTFPLIKINTEDSTGNYLFNTKNCHDCFNIDQCQDCSYCTDIHNSRDSYDTHIYQGELMYECIHAGPQAYNNIGIILCWFSSNIFYSCELHHCKDMFGCASLKHKQYCILNKQYTKEQYEELVPKIIEHMQRTGEWGEFFPVKNSPYGYDQTMAAYYQPLSKEESIQQGFNWNETSEKTTEKTDELPDKLSDFSKSMLTSTFTSIQSNQPYKIIEKEFEFHKKFNIPLQRITPKERLIDFINQNPRNLNTNTDKTV